MTLNLYVADYCPFLYVYKLQVSCHFDPTLVMVVAIWLVFVMEQNDVDSG